MTRDEALKRLRADFELAYETAVQDIESGANNSDIPYKCEIPLSPELIQVLAERQVR